MSTLSILLKVLISSVKKRGDHTAQVYTSPTHSLCSRGITRWQNNRHWTAAKSQRAVTAEIQLRWVSSEVLWLHCPTHEQSPSSQLSTTPTICRADGDNRWDNEVTWPRSLLWRPCYTHLSKKLTSLLPLIFHPGQLLPPGTSHKDIPLTETNVTGGGRKIGNFILKN